ncbi:hypothetical protein, partial [Mesorhizobium sp.]|uniref:hypothetical protein n=1 Tax=Mesorhizobium sp. TaxID=1871066 RepID=UPI0025C01280
MAIGAFAKTGECWTGARMHQCQAPQSRRDLNDIETPLSGSHCTRHSSVHVGSAESGIDADGEDAGLFLIGNGFGYPIRLAEENSARGIGDRADVWRFDL